jgi:type IV secretion system protein VirB10
MATGYYAPLEKEGQERLMITWVRIDTPSGINIHVANAEMADAMGRAGVTGEIDHKYFDKYGVPLLTTAIQAVAAYSVPVNSSGQAAMVESFGSSLATMGQQALDENIDIAPTVTIKAGEHILISPMKDIWFKEPVKRTIQAVAVED